MPTQGRPGTPAPPGHPSTARAGLPCRRAVGSSGLWVATDKGTRTRGRHVAPAVTSPARCSERLSGKRQGRLPWGWGTGQAGNGMAVGRRGERSRWSGPQAPQGPKPAAGERTGNSENKQARQQTLTYRSQRRRGPAAQAPPSTTSALAMVAGGSPGHAGHKLSVALGPWPAGSWRTLAHRHI